MRVKPFVRCINYNHMMPTRYNLDVSEKLAKLIPDDTLGDAEKTKAVRREVKKALEERYKALAGVAASDKVSTGVTYFFKSLKVRRDVELRCGEGRSRSCGAPSAHIFVCHAAALLSAASHAAQRAGCSAPLPPLHTRRAPSHPTSLLAVLTQPVAY